MKRLMQSSECSTVNQVIPKRKIAIRIADFCWHSSRVHRKIKRKNIISCCNWFFCQIEKNPAANLFSRNLWCIIHKTIHFPPVFLRTQRSVLLLADDETVSLPADLNVIGFTQLVRALRFNQPVVSGVEQGDTRALAKQVASQIALIKIKLSTFFVASLVFRAWPAWFGSGLWGMKNSLELFRAFPTSFFPLHLYCLFVVFQEWRLRCVTGLTGRIRLSAAQSVSFE